MFTTKVPVGFHGKRTSVFVAESARDGRNINVALDANRGEKVPQAVVGDSSHADFHCGSVHRLLALANFEEHFGSNLIGPICKHSREQVSGLRIQGHLASVTVLGAFFGVAKNRQNFTGEAHMISSDPLRFADANTRVGEAFDKVGAVFGIAAMSTADLQ